MAKDYQIHFFNEYPPNEILKERYYIDSIKHLSFSYRHKDSDELVAFIAVKKEQSPIRIEGIDTTKGCRIIQMRVRCINSGGFTVIDTNVLDNLLQNAFYYIKGWDDESNQSDFAYIWFDITDFEQADDLIEIMEYVEHNENIVYKIIER